MLFAMLERETPMRWLSVLPLVALLITPATADLYYAPGSWDAIGADNRSINASSASFTTTALSDTVTLRVNSLAGTIQSVVTAIPEPSSFLFAGLAGLGFVAARLRKRRR